MNFYSIFIVKFVIFFFLEDSNWWKEKDERKRLEIWEDRSSSRRRKIDIKNIKDGLLSKTRVTVYERERFFFLNRIVGGAFNDAKNKGKRNGKHSRPGSRVYTDKQMEKQPFRFNKETAGRSNDILFSEIYPAFSGGK